MSAIRFSGAIREVRILLCQRSAASSGARAFISEHYVGLKKENPATPILVRECSGVTPVLFARFSHGREKSRNLTDLTSSEILESLESIHLEEAKVASSAVVS